MFRLVERNGGNETMEIIEITSNNTGNSPETAGTVVAQ